MTDPVGPAQPGASSFPLPTQQHAGGQNFPPPNAGGPGFPPPSAGAPFPGTPEAKPKKKFSGKLLGILGVLMVVAVIVVI